MTENAPPTASTITDDQLDALHQRLDTLQAANLQYNEALEGARDLLEAAGHIGAHADDWPEIAPALQALIAERDQLRAELDALRNPARLHGLITSHAYEGYGHGAPCTAAGYGTRCGEQDAAHVESTRGCS
ncbi:hypothetical protein [Streptomyces carpaticus]|uniref:hypothetical protein n=1 Tax=Streptomyces carpaticus TaxID=285558 RepID=UPI0031F8113A